MKIGSFNSKDIRNGITPAISKGVFYAKVVNE
jgi:hypothetical protein